MRHNWATAPRKNTSPRVLVKHGKPYECCMAILAVFRLTWFLCHRLWRWRGEGLTTSSNNSSKYSITSTVLTVQAKEWTLGCYQPLTHERITSTVIKKKKKSHRLGRKTTFSFNLEISGKKCGGKTARTPKNPPDTESKVINGHLLFFCFGFCFCFLFVAFLLVLWLAT